MTLDATALVAIASIMMVSALIQGATGFGFGLFVMALLPLFLSLRDVSMALPLVLVPMILINFWARLCHFRWHEVKWMFVGALLGVAPGIYLLAQLNDTILKRILGAVLVVAAIHANLKPKQNARETPTWSVLLLGLSSGMLGGAFNTGGPPAIYYFYHRPWPVQQIIVSLQFIFLSIAITKVIMGTATRTLTPASLEIALVGALPVLIGLLLGIRLSKHLEGPLARRIAFSLLGLLGAYLVISG